MEHNSDLLKREYMRALFPVMFSVLGGTINTFIDGALVSGKMGEQGLAAVNLCMPIYLVICTLGILVGGGASVMSSRFLGEGEVKNSISIYRTATTLCIIFGIATSLAGLILCSPISMALSQGGELYPLVREYAFITFIGLIPTAYIYIPLFYLQIIGKEKSITTSMIIMIVTDVVLDILFLYVLDFGLTGAAAASVVASLACCLYCMVVISASDKDYTPAFTKPNGFNTRAIILAGLPSGTGSLCDAAKLLFVNTMVLSAGGTGAAAIWAVLNSIAEISRSITSGVPRTAGPITGLYHTSRENSGLRIIMDIQHRTGYVLAIVFSILLCVFHGFIEGLFSTDKNMFLPFVCLGFYIIFELESSIWVTYFNSTMHILLSGILIVCKSLLMPVAAAFFVIRAGLYLWLFIPLGGFLAVVVVFITTGYAAAKGSRKGSSLSRFLLLDEHLEKEGRVLDFSVLPTPDNISDATERIKEYCTNNAMDSKQTMRLGLAIEEVLQIFVEKTGGKESVDLRAISVSETICLRIRIVGPAYDPFTDTDDDEIGMLGITMLKNLAEVVDYNYVMGMNVLNILF